MGVATVCVFRRSGCCNFCSVPLFLHQAIRFAFSLDEKHFMNTV